MSQLSRRVWVAAVAVAMIAASLGAGAPAVDAKAGFTFDRIAGPDRYDTARQLAKASFPSGTDTAVLASGERFPDALAGSFLAGARNAPVLLTQGAVLSGPAKLALSELKVRNVIVLGGPIAVSTLVENDLKGTDSTASGGGKLIVTRIAGADRYETARLIATAAGTSPSPVGGQRTVLVATGEAFPDALAGGPLAFASKLPVVLTTRDALHPQAKQALEALNAKQALILGGVAAVSTTTEDQIKATGGITTVRLAGADRTDTATKVADYAIANLGFTNTHVNLARGDDFADALGGGSHGGVDKAPIVLTFTPSDLGATTKAYLVKQSPTLANGHIFGGVNAVSDAVKTEAETAARGTGGGGGGGGGSTDTVAPTMVTAVANTTAKTVTVTYSEVVTCTNDAPTRQQFAYTGATATVPTGISCPGTATVVLTFADIGGTGNLTYTDESVASDANDVKDLAGNSATSPQTVTATGSSGGGGGGGGGGGSDTTSPSIVSGVASTTAKTVTLTYSEGVTCPDDAPTRAQFSYAGAAPTAPTSVTCNGSTTVTLAFTNVTGGGTLTYTDENPAADANDVKDAAGNAATSPQSITVSASSTPAADTAPPRILTATANATNETVQLIYNEPVVCVDDTATRQQFTYAGAAPPQPTSILCNDTEIVTLAFTNVAGAGGLSYTDESPSTSDANDVKDRAGNSAQSPQTIQAGSSPPAGGGADTTPPAMVTATANATAETVTVIYSEPVNCPDSAKSQFAYQGASPQQPTAAACNGSATVTLSFTDVTGSGSLLYLDDNPGALDANDVRDLANNAATSPQNQPVVSTADATRPSIVSAVANPPAKVVVLTYNEGVRCTDLAATRAQFNYTSGETSTPAAVTCDGSPTVTLSYDAIPNNGVGSLTYTDENASADGNDVLDTAGNQATSPQQIATTSTSDTIRPRILTATANAVEDVIVLDYSEPVRCTIGTDPVGRAQFTYEGIATSTVPTSVRCGGSIKVVLSFENITGTGNLRYNDDIPATTDPNDVVDDPAGNQAETPQTVAATTTTDLTRPSMVSAVANPNSGVELVIVTYSEDVTCDSESTSANEHFSYSMANPPRPTEVICPESSGTSVTLKFADVTGPGNLTYTDTTPGSDPGGDIRDSSGNSATSPQTISATSTVDSTPPTMLSAVANATNETVTITYSEAVICNDTQALRQFYSFTGASFPTPSRVTCNQTSTVVLSFDDVTAAGVLSYTDRTPNSAERDVKDNSGNPALSPQSVPATTP